MCDCVWHTLYYVHIGQFLHVYVCYSYSLHTHCMQYLRFICLVIVFFALFYLPAACPLLNRSPTHPVARSPSRPVAHSASFPNPCPPIRRFISLYARQLFFRQHLQLLHVVRKPKIERKTMEEQSLARGMIFQYNLEKLQSITTNIRT